MASNILNFSPNRLITGINIIDGMLFFTDNENEPKKINIEKFKGNFEGVEIDHSSGTTHIYGRPMREGDITVIKDHPIGALTTVKLNEAFGTGANDLTTNSISESDNYGVDSQGKEIINPAEGNAEVSIDSNSTTNTSFTGRLLTNEGQIAEGGFIWSSTEDTIEGLVNGIGSSSVEIISKNINSGDGVAIIQKSIQSADASSPTYESSLSTGDINVVSFGKKKGSSTRFYSNVKKSKILDNTAAGSAPSNLTLSEPTINNNIVVVESTLLNDGDAKITNSGLYISQGRINDNDPAPTVQDLLNDGTIIPSTFDQGTGKLTSRFEAVPNLIYYYIPFVRNKNGIVYGNDSLVSDTVINKVQNKTGRVAPVNTLNVIDHTNTSAVLRGHSNGNNYLSALRYSEITELGFYFSNNEAIKEDIITKSFTNGVSSDGKTFKVSVADNYDEGGIFSLNTASYLTLLDGEELNFIAYNVSGGIENTGKVEIFKKPEYPKEPLFGISKLNWNFPSTYNLSSFGTENIETTIEFDIIGKPNNNSTNIVDAGIIISKPITEAEIEKSKNGYWSDVKSLINPDNAFILTLPKSDFTFTANNSDSDIGRYVNTNPITVPAVTDEEYYNLIKKNIKLSVPNFRAVAYIIDGDGVTHYSEPFGDPSKDNVNPDTKPKFIKPIIGGPRIITSSSNGEFISVLENNNFTVLGEISNSGKRITEAGAYVSTTAPTSINILPDGRSPDLDAWAASATKFLATESVSTINAHIDQNTNDLLNLTIPITGRTPETTYYVALFTKPEQTTSTGSNSKTINGSEAFKNLLNGNKWTLPREVNTPPALTQVDVDPILTIVEDGVKESLTKTSVSIESKAEKPSLNYSITEIGVYLKPASEFSNPFSDQSGNAATMASSTNRIEKKLNLTNNKENGKNEEISFTADVTGITTVEYYASTFVKTNTNGNIQTFISPYISIDNSVNSSILTKEYTGAFLISNFDTFARLAFPERINNMLYAGASWRVEDSVPEIINYGFYFLENQSLAYPTSASNFMQEYNSPGAGTTTHNVTIAGAPTRFSGGLNKGYTYSEPLPFNVDFPTDNVGKFYYVIGFYETVNNFFGFTPVEKITVMNPTEYVSGGFFSLSRLSINEILYRRGNVNAFRAAGITTFAGDVFKGKNYEYVDVEVYAQKDWDFDIHGTGLSTSGTKNFSAWPAPIIRNNNTLRIYTPKNNPKNSYALISCYLLDGVKEGKGSVGGFAGLNKFAVNTNAIGNIALRWYKP